jgi:cellobiose-specific phosphotransferase system component IIA
MRGMTEEEALGALMKNTLGLVHAEDLLVDAVRDLLREEVKRRKARSRARTDSPS